MVMLESWFGTVQLARLESHYEPPLKVAGPSSRLQGRYFAERTEPLPLEDFPGWPCLHWAEQLGMKQLKGVY